MTKHTSEPWLVVVHTMASNYITIQAENEAGHLLPIAGMTNYHKEHKLANANLIGAAPKLLKACGIGLAVAKWAADVRNAPTQLAGDIKEIESAMAAAEKGA